MSEFLHILKLVSDKMKNLNAWFSWTLITDISAVHDLIYIVFVCNKCIMLKIINEFNSNKIKI